MERMDWTEEQELLDERRKLALGRVREIPGEGTTPGAFRDFFEREAEYILRMEELGARLSGGVLETGTAEELAELNRAPYEDVIGERYETSFGNPAYAVRMLGDGYGQLFSYLYQEILGLAVYLYEDRLWERVVVLELFLYVYQLFSEGEVPPLSSVREAVYWYVSDYSDERAERRVRELVDPALCFAARIVMEAELRDPRYLYRYGEYVTENEVRTAEFLAGLSQEEIDAMARTYTEGYRIGFVVGRKDLSKKRTVDIRYHLGFERMVRAAVGMFREMGLSPVIYRGTGLARSGFAGAAPNRQLDYDHRNDEALILDEDLAARKIRALQVAFEKHKALARVHGGPAVIETFGESPFAPQSRPEVPEYSPRQQKLRARLRNEAAQIQNRYIIGEERSFTIIAYPLPEIGPEYPAIFRETVRINTLDYQKYQRIQQRLIDALDTGRSVRILGRGKNRTDLTVQLHRLADPARQTNFENCVADVNIPVGEVFTSPVLKGTAGVLHVTGVYLAGLYYRDLELSFADGMIQGYSCGNFPTEEENRRYLEENVLFHHETLPLGEFAIGTNTAAYVMARRFGIADKLPILIAEKMGPHFAVGDTCYSWSEDTAVYNPDGKEIVARDNEVSILRKTDPGKAYFGCHTDITIPYDELGSIRVERGDGSSFAVIEDGRFVLPGTEELNEAFAKGPEAGR